MTRARILNPAPSRPPASRPAAAARDLPWLDDTPQPVRPARQRRGARPLAVPALARLAVTARTALASLRPRHRATRDLAPMSFGKKAALLIAIITVPAMAAPRDLALFAAPAPAPVTPDPLALAAANALPFERPGMSFPGSAFFFLDDPASGALVALPTADPLGSGAEAGRELGEFIATGPAAKPFFSSGTGVSHGRALECLAQAVWYEAASESEAGQRAVAQVVLNRLAHPNWPNSVCGVVYQGAERATGCQFTFTCDGSLARRPSGTSWARAQRIAAAALSGEVYEPVGHATHYHTLWVDPYWARTLDHVGTIGAHRFYRNRGAGGEKAAFTMAYAGFEPVVSGRTTAALRPAANAAAALFTPSSPPLAEQGMENVAARKNAGNRATRKSKNPAPRNDTLREFEGAGEVLPEFANAGAWKVDPATIK